MDGRKRSLTPSLCRSSLEIDAINAHSKDAARGDNKHGEMGTLSLTSSYHDHLIAYTTASISELAMPKPTTAIIGLLPV